MSLMERVSEAQRYARMVSVQWELSTCHIVSLQELQDGGGGMIKGKRKGQALDDGDEAVEFSSRKRRKFTRRH